MRRLIEYSFLFVSQGIIWFFIFSIPTGKDQNIFLALQKGLGFNHQEVAPRKTKEINRVEVIDALTKAFQP